MKARNQSSTGIFAVLLSSHLMPLRLCVGTEPSEWKVRTFGERE